LFLVPSEIYFGRHYLEHKESSTRRFSEFLSQVVIPLFLLGMTVYDACGRMQHTRGAIVKQKARVILLAHRSPPEDDRKIRQTIDTCRSMFDSLQVMLLTKVVHPVFYPD